jgi:hypothetical protein
MILVSVMWSPSNHRRFAWLSLPPGAMKGHGHVVKEEKQ